ncbi:Type II inositol 1,4,5-trisphosphate 5-phosphatase [Amphibalanus amphitrite]|uniref:phosphoinositide 5-phosphatase n=1 Tax=Amphibalanus amphitrite TaxID=1232801 RepID=A0A6A4V804_AMPAM|nr:Type II inositol 1,4,5-trisphosphate 5-phosphatase [Amphibalanus amphitrite]
MLTNASEDADGPEGPSMDPTTMVKKLLLSPERIVCCLEARLAGPPGLGPGARRILALVQHADGRQRALFVLAHSVAGGTEVDIETVLPVTNDFICGIDTNGLDESDSHLYVRLKSPGGEPVTFAFPQGDITNSFVEQIMMSIEAALGGDHQFGWVQQYRERASRASDKEPSQPNQQTRPHTSHAQSSELDAGPRRAFSSGAPATTRETQVKFEMSRKEEAYTDIHQLSRLHRTKPVSDWLASTAEPPDIYAIGFQELDLSKEAFLFTESPKEDEWLTMVLTNLHPRASYRRVRLVRLVGMMLIVLVQERHAAYVRNVAAECVGTGIMGKMGNKGGVAVRLEVHSTSMCFVSAHLAAHVEEYERRNQDYADICHRMRFNALVSPKAIKDHDQVFWLGDLNYRITDVDVDKVKEMIERGAMEKVMEADQLRLQMAARRVFDGFHEGTVTFRPTYKYDPGTDLWDSSEKNRAPAWCDRVLWKGERIRQLHYTSHPSLRLSDHKPVKVIDPTKYRKIYEDIMKELDKYENDSLPQVSVDTTELIFGTVHFFETKTQTLTITNTGKVAVQYRFINKLNDTTYCKQWLTVDPHFSVIMPGERCEVSLEVRVDDRTASKLNTCQEKLYDILVLHLEKGKDIFITVQGDYVRSCFGVSINALVHIKTPFAEVPVSRLLDLESASPKELTHNPYVIPKELWFLVDQLQKQGIGKDLFGQSGLPAEICRIREALDTTLPETLPGSIHSVAEALLLFLASLPEPVIPNSYVVQCMESSDNFIQSKHIVSQLPPHHKNVFTYICTFLREVVDKTPPDRGGLEPTTLAKIFGGVLIRNPSAAWQQRNNMSLETLDRRKTTFVYHFLVNEIDI